MITDKQFSDRMMVMDSVTIIGFGVISPIIGRAYQENLMLFWLTLQTFMEFGCGWLINRLLEYTKIKQRIFKAIQLAFIICVILDVISICIFISTRNYIILLFVDIICSACIMCVNDAFNEITNCMFEKKTALSAFHRRDRKYMYGANAFTKGVAMLVAGVFIKNNAVSENTMIILQFVYLVAEIISDYGYYKYLYLPCKNKVFETWNKEESTHE